MGGSPTTGGKQTAPLQKPGMDKEEGSSSTSPAACASQDKQEEQDTKPNSRKGENESDQKDDAAARMIQRNFRGYRTRRELEGMGLDANTRWGEAFKALQLDNARDQQMGKKGGGTDNAMGKWKRGGLLVGQIAGSPSSSKKDGGADPNGGSMSDGPVPGGPSLHEKGEENNDAQGGLPAGGKPEKRDSDGMLGDVPGAYEDNKIDNVHRIAKPDQRGLRMIEWWTRGAAAQDLSKTMEATYWLEMVDRKHRYGSNLKPYHAAWSKADTKDNFFIWLDEGDGKDLDLPDCPREQLDRECVEYLSAEQRMNYVVDIKDGKLYWRRNGKPVDTTKNKHRDLGQGKGIVELGPEEQEELKRLKEERRQQQAHDDGSSFSGSSSSSDASDSEEQEEVAKAAEHYGAGKPKKHRRLGMLSSKGFMDALLRKTVQANTWIYVLNCRRELYVGIKQTGKFQHSSFLYGGRVLSAGLLKVSNGTLTSLSPLSGHYRAGTAHFRHFVWLLQQEGVDLEHVTLSKSLLMLRGMEAYGKLKGAGKHRSKEKGKESRGAHKDKEERRRGTAGKKELEDKPQKEERKEEKGEKLSHEKEQDEGRGRDMGNETGTKGEEIKKQHSTPSTLLPPSQQVQDQSKCSICHEHPSRYTCPTCNIPYCSLACFKDGKKHGGCLATFQNKTQDELREASRLNHESDKLDERADGERRRILDLLRNHQSEQDDDKGDNHLPTLMDQDQGEQDSQSEASDSLSPHREMTEAGLPASTSDLLAMLSNEQRDVFLAAVGQEKQRSDEQEIANVSNARSRHLERAKKLWEKITADEQHIAGESSSGKLWWTPPVRGTRLPETSSTGEAVSGISTFSKQVLALLAARNRTPSSSPAEGLAWNCIALLTAYTYTLSYLDIPSFVSILGHPSTQHNDAISTSLRLLHKLAPFLFALPAHATPDSSSLTTASDTKLLLASPTDVTTYILSRLGDEDRSSRPSQLMLELYRRVIGLLDQAAIVDAAQSEYIDSGKPLRALGDIWQLVEHALAHSEVMNALAFPSSEGTRSSSSQIRRSLQQASKKLVFYSAICAYPTNSSQRPLLSSPSILGSAATVEPSTDAVTSLSSLSLQAERNIRPHRIRREDARTLREEMDSLRTETEALEDEERWEAARRLEEGSGPDKAQVGRRAGTLIEAVDEPARPDARANMPIVQPMTEQTGKAGEEKADAGVDAGGREGPKAESFIEKRLARQRKEAEAGAIREDNSKMKAKMQGIFGRIGHSGDGQDTRARE